MVSNLSDSLIDLNWSKLKNLDRNEIMTLSSGNYDSLMQSNLLSSLILISHYGVKSLNFNNTTPINLFIHNRISTSIKNYWPIVEECYNSVNLLRNKLNAPKTHEVQYLLDGLFLGVYDKSLILDNVDSILSIVHSKLPHYSSDNIKLNGFIDDYNELIKVRILKTVKTLGSWERTQVKGLPTNGNFTILKKSDRNYYVEILDGGLLYPKKLIVKKKDRIFKYVDDFMGWHLLINKTGEVELQNEFGDEILTYKRINN